ncbi:MAG: hypothetical protein Q4A62_06185 [Eikenella sp.]|nr:hypothetical protein [Eikenella sp.]
MMWVMSERAVRDYPVLAIDVPSDAEHSPEFQAWAKKNRYRLKPDGSYAKGSGLLTSVTEIRFAGSQMLVQECVNFLFARRRFALNAPVMLGKPVRKSKLNRLNQLLAGWRLPPVPMAKAKPAEHRVRIRP